MKSHLALLREKSNALLQPPFNKQRGAATNLIIAMLKSRRNHHHYCTGCCGIGATTLMIAVVTMLALFQNHSSSIDDKIGPRQKVIAFTYFRSSEDSSKRYVEGTRGNLEAIGQIYSATEWTMRLYHNLEDLEDLKIHQLQQHLVLCDVNDHPLLGNASVIWPTLWRFLAILDDQVTGAADFAKCQIC